MKRLAIMLIVAVALVGLYVAWPFWAAHQLRKAITDGDVSALNRRVDWPSLRASFKETLAAELVRDMKAQDGTAKAQKSDGEAADQALSVGLLAALAPMMIDQAVDAYVTPQGIIALTASASGARLQQFAYCSECVKRAELVGTTRFEFEVGPADGKSAMLGVLELQGFDWKLTKIVALQPRVSPGTLQVGTP